MQGSQNRDFCGSRGSQNLASGRGPRASCRGQKIRPVVPDLVLLVEVPKSSPRCGGLPGPLRGSHFDGAVVTVVLRVGRDLVLSARVRGHVGVTSPSPCPEKWSKEIVIHNPESEVANFGYNAHNYDFLRTLLHSFFYKGCWIHLTSYIPYFFWNLTSLIP